MTRNYVLITCLWISIFQSCGTHQPQFPGEAHPASNTLVDSGFTKEKLDSLTSYLENNLATTGMLILKDGQMIYEYGDVKEVSYLASCRKSILSMLYGKYVENGTIDLNETIGSIGVDEADGLLEIEKTATVDHLLNARSGVFHEPANGGYDKHNILARGSVEPGAYFVYNNWDFNVAGYVLEQKTGKSVYQILEEQLAIPLGFQDWNIKNQKRKVNKKKSKYDAYHMYISTRDMAKIGQLMLNKGTWNGQELISKEWIEKITTPVTSVEIVNERYGKNESSAHQFAYGYLWWMVDNINQNPNLKGAYSAQGWGGQFITIIPKLNIVVAHKYKVPTLVNWGLRPGGVSEYQYWEMLDQVLSTVENQ